MGTHASVQPGLKGSASVSVRKQDLASAYGNKGVEVLSSMTLMTLLEQSCIDALEGFLSKEEMTVGAHMEMDHLSPTPAGFTVTAEAQLVQVSGKKLVFKVSAYDEVSEVAQAQHVRFVVERDRFLESVAAKAAQGGEN